MAHSPIITVAITRQTKAVERASFGVLMVLGVHKVFHERIKYFTSPDAVLTEGFSSTDPEYIAVNAALAQNPRPEKVAIGTRHANDVVITPVAVNNAVYTITINSATGALTTFQYTADATATVAEITAGLQALIPGASGLPVSATDDTTSITLSSNPAGSLYSAKLTATLGATLTAGTLVAAETPEVAAAAIKIVDNDWYGIVETLRVQAEVESLAAWVESNKKLFVAPSNDANIINLTDAADTISISAKIKAAAYDRTAAPYFGDLAAFPDAAWFGKQLPTDPGSSTMAFKVLAGIIPDNLTTTQSKNAHDKNASTYEKNGGVNILFEGWVGSGEFIDIIRGIDWTESEIIAAIFSRKVNLPKIPFTDAGLTIIEAEIKTVLAVGVDVGLYTEDPAPNVILPLVANVLAADKAVRTLNNVIFTATLQGAVHHTGVAGVVTL